jgi:hypothetical protein
VLQLTVSGHDDELTCDRVEAETTAVQGDFLEYNVSRRATVLAKGPRVAKGIIGVPLEVATGEQERIGRVATSAHNDGKGLFCHRANSPRRRTVGGREECAGMSVVQIINKASNL